MARFVSVGGDCQAGLRVSAMNPGGVHHFFDWLAISIQSTIRLIESDFRDFLTWENLHPIYNGEILAGVIDTQLRVEFAHDFSGFTREECDSARARYELRARWFRELFEEDEPAPYFVRRWHPRDGADDEASAIRLFKLLRAKRRDISFLYLHKDPTRGELVSGAYRSAYLPPPTSEDWMGNEDAWNYMLKDFAVRPLADVQAPIMKLNMPRFA
ncbi:hypothetical protein HN018_18850 [Lichenicola cladoniae]|uniref:Papain-like cysteine peptidase n=1 Tax=Lichenicola cladoniae TaxID=1484109 RepID=A0A6M8HUG5_9PROT|nr:DUF1796 family putative cysteine peptidase [Lichenicola cladoniae]NPD67529.1 hypothetical protein [Acetobacteraceae bacterium]QKE91817.1 hypothetical protein HN018_18850 [Lichenicola cladoniae]